MRKRFVIFFLVSLCLIVGARVDALSLEAQSVIESMRLKLNAPTQVEPPAQVCYVPGQELAAAMSRLRQQLYGVDTARTEIAAIPSPEPALITPSAATDYSVGDLLSAALMKVRYSQGRAESLRVVMADIDAEVSVAPSTPDLTTTEIEKPAETDVSAEPSPLIPQVQLTTEIDTQVAKAVAAEKVKAAKSEKKHKKKRANTKAIARKSAPVVEKTVAGKAFSGEASAPSSSASVKVESTSLKTEEDKKFNEFIKKYDFKMPENYRIIVR